MTRVLADLRRTDRLVGVALVVVSAVGFGSGPFLANAAYDTGMDAMPILFWRFVAAAGLSWGFVALSGAARRSLWTLTRRRIAVLLALGLMYVGNSFTYVASLELVDVSLVAMIVYIYPALVAVLSVRFGRRLEGRRAWAALGLSTTGVLLAVGGVPDPGMPPAIGLALAVASPVIYAFWIILSARTAGERRGEVVTAARADPPPTPATPAAAVASTFMITGTATGCAAFLLLVGPGISPSDVPGGAWPALIAFGGASAVAIQAFYGGVRRIGGARASLISTVEPVYTIAIATLVLGETLTPVQLAGGALVIAGVLLAESGSSHDRSGSSRTWRGRPRPLSGRQERSS